MKRKLLVLSFTVVMLTGCSNQFANSNYNNEQKIASEYNTFGLQEVEQNIENSRFECKATIDGMDEIWSYDAEEAEDIDIYYLMNGLILKED